MNIQNWLENIAHKCPRGLALVTGSSRGIGRKLVEELAKNDFSVLPTARSLVQKKFESQNENIFSTVYLDVTKKDSILELADFLKTNQIKINLMIHNAGIGPKYNANALDLDSSVLKCIYDTNVFGLIETNNQLKECYSDNAIIVMLSSTMGHISRDDYTAAAYRLSKRTVMQFARQAALQSEAENKKWIFLSLHPGSVKTDMNPSGKISDTQSAQNILKLFDNQMIDKLRKHNGGFWSLDEIEQNWQLIG